MFAMSPTRRHPLTGLPLQPIYVRRDGVVFWPVIGAAPDDDAGGGQSAGDGGTTDGSTAGGGGAGDSDGDAGSTKADKPVSREDFERLRNQLSASDRRRDEAEKRLKEIEDKDKDELTKASEKVKELEEVNSKLQTELAQTRLELAFVSVNEVTWHNPKTALRTARDEGLLEAITKEDGSVDEAKLKKALDGLKKTHPYLVKTSTDQAAGGGSTGQPVGSGARGNGAGGPNEAELRKKYGRVLQ